jgi:hypothetical protein
MPRLERRRGRRHCRRGALWDALHTGSARRRPPSPGAVTWLEDPAWLLFRRLRVTSAAWLEKLAPSRGPPGWAPEEGDLGKIGTKETALGGGTPPLQSHAMPGAPRSGGLLGRERFRPGKV